ncbi:MAG: hypothetical protein WCE49_12005, partial [Terrimicrobiaceae bacterium]
VQKMPRLRLRPRGLIPGISFGREPSNSTGGTFTRVASGFPGARCLRQLVIRARPNSDSGHRVTGTSLLIATFGWVMK